MTSLTLAINCRRVLSFIGVLSAIVCFSTSVLAVEDGLGTNVVKNLRVLDDGTLIIEGGGSITLSGQPIMDWNDLIQEIEYDSHAIMDTLSNKVWRLETSTNAVNARVIDLEAATNALNGRVNAVDAAATGTVAVLQIATNAVNARVNAIDAATTGTVAVLQFATNSLNDLKYDKTGGPISGAVTMSNNVTIYGVVTMTNKVVYTPGAAVAVVAGTSIDSGTAVRKISSIGDIVMTINPPIALGTAGQMITLLYAGANSIGFTNCSTLNLSGGVGFTMKDNDAIQCVSDGAKWMEVHRADNQ